MRKGNDFLRCILILGLIFSVSEMISAELPRQETNYVEVKDDVDETFSYDSKSITKKEAYAFFVTLRSKQSVHAIQMVRNKDFLVVVGRSRDDTDDDFGLRLFVFRETKNKLELLYKGKGLYDTYVATPYIFKGLKKDEMLILLDTGFEYSTGFDIYRIEKNKVEHVSSLDATLADAATDDFGGSALSKTKIRYANNQYIVEISAVVNYIAKGKTDDDAVLIKSKKGIVTFIFNGKEFLPANPLDIIEPPKALPNAQPSSPLPWLIN